ncbi:MAG: hypothetical protein ABSD39_00170 [Terriglobales bacterium]|jgi:hypothetical protein
MTTPEEVVKIRAEIEKLEKARRECADSGIQKRIDNWIEKEKRKLPRAS